MHYVFLLPRPSRYPRAFGRRTSCARLHLETTGDLRLQFAETVLARKITLCLDVYLEAVGLRALAGKARGRAKVGAGNLIE